MQVTRVHFMADDVRPSAFFDIDRKIMDDLIPLSRAMATCLTVDIQNQVVKGRGTVVPTPWGWCWYNDHDAGEMPVPPKLYHIHTHQRPIPTVPLKSLYIQPERR